MKQFINELVGTLLLTTIILASQCNINPNLSQLGPFASFLALLLSLQVGIPTVGHVNPAVSTGMLVYGKLPIKVFMRQILPAQFLGALFGALIVYFLSLPKINDSQEDKKEIIEVFSRLKSDDHEITIISSFIASFIYLFAIGAIVNPKNSKVPDFLVRLYVPFALMAVSLISTNVNPAFDLSPRLISLIAFGSERFKAYLLIPLITPFFGGAAGAYCYKQFSKITLIEEQKIITQQYKKQDEKV